MRHSKFAIRAVLSIIVIMCAQSVSASAAAVSCRTINEIKLIAGKDMVCAKNSGKLSWKPATVKFPKIILEDYQPVPDGFEMRVANYSDAIKITLSSTTGEVSWNGDGIITVTGDLNPKGTLTVKAAVGKFFRIATYSGPAFELKQLPIPILSSNSKQNDEGIDVEILNFDSENYWEIESSKGSAVIDSTGLVSVFGITEPGQVSFTLHVSADGYKSVSKVFNFLMPSFSIKPKLGTIENRTQTSFTFRIENFDPIHKWNVTSTSGQAQVSSTGIVSVTGITPNSYADVTVTASREGFITQSSEISGSTVPSFSILSERDWALIAKDPAGNSGRYVVVYGYITQFDAATGLDQFRADVNGVNSRNSYGLTGDNSFLSGSSSILRNFVAKDYFTAKVIVKGVKTYTTTLNGTLSVPWLEIVEITRN